MLREYRTIYAPVSASFIEKKSEFIASIAPVTSNDQAVAFLESIRKENRKARHNVYAYCLREDNIIRYSDDGEPQGTAGMPVLDVLQKSALTDICCVVTRYFGGVLLGANGLVRAYSHSASLAVGQAKIRRRCLAYPVTVTLDYTLYGKLIAHLMRDVMTEPEIDFAENVQMRFFVLELAYEEWKKQIVEDSAGRAMIAIGDLCFADFS